MHEEVIKKIFIFRRKKWTNKTQTTTSINVEVRRRRKFSSICSIKCNCRTRRSQKCISNRKLKSAMENRWTCHRPRPTIAPHHHRPPLYRRHQIHNIKSIQCSMDNRWMEIVSKNRRHFKNLNFLEMGDLEKNNKKFIVA